MGHQRIRKIATEPEEEKESLWRFKPKEAFDLGLRILGLFAIAVPVFLFFKSQQAERDKQKVLFQLDVYTKASVALHSLLDQDFTSQAFDSIRNVLLYEIYPKMILVNEKEIIDNFNITKDAIIFANFVARIRMLNGTQNEIREKFKPTDPKTDSLAPVAFFSRESIRLSDTYRRWKKGKVTTFTDKFIEEIEQDIQTLDILGEHAMMIAFPLQGESNAMDTVYRKEFKDLIPDHVMGFYAGFYENFEQNLASYTSKLDSLMVKSSKFLYNK